MDPPSIETDGLLIVFIDATTYAPLRGCKILIPPKNMKQDMNDWVKDNFEEGLLVTKYIDVLMIMMILENHATMRTTNQ